MAINNFTVFGHKKYQPGTYTSPSVNYDGSGITLEFAINDSNWPNEDPALTVDLQCWQSFDNGATWDYSDAQPHNGLVFEQTFAPGPLKNPSGPHGAFTVYDGFGPRQVRAVMIVAGAAVSLDVTASTNG